MHDSASDPSAGAGKRGGARHCPGGRREDHPVRRQGGRGAENQDNARRLRLLYGSRAAISVESGPEGETVAEILVPQDPIPEGEKE